MQAHLARGQQRGCGRAPALCGGRMVACIHRTDVPSFVGRLHPNDRVLLVGDTRQGMNPSKPAAFVRAAPGRGHEDGEVGRDRAPERPGAETGGRTACGGEVGEAVPG